MYKTQPDFETKNGGKKCVLNTGIYGRYNAFFRFWCMADQLLVLSRYELHFLTEDVIFLEISDSFVEWGKTNATA